MHSEQEERLVRALEDVAYALISISKTMELTYFRTHPPPRTPRDIAVTHPPTEEEKLRAEQGATGETTTDDWMTLDHGEEEEQPLGPYEQKFNDEQKRGTRGRGEDQSRPREPGRRSSKTGA